MPAMFPLQVSRNVPPGPREIPWSVAEKAYGAYCQQYYPHGGGQSLERLAERGGFGWCEMDKFYPPWRDEVSEVVKLRAEIQMLKRIACHVPGRVYLKAKEDAGFGTAIKLDWHPDLSPKAGENHGTALMPD